MGLVDAQLSTVSVWARATAKDTPAAGAGAEAESPRSAPNAPTTTEEEESKPAAPAAPVAKSLEDEKVNVKKASKGGEDHSILVSISLARALCSMCVTRRLLACYCLMSLAKSKKHATSSTLVTPQTRSMDY